MKRSPLVSVIIANFNGEKYLETCLTSVLKTAYSSLEIIIIDDGSTDSSIDIVQSFINRDNRIKLLKNDINIGAASCRNKAAKLAIGEIFIFLDNDTEVNTNWVTNMVRTILRDDAIGACQALLIDFNNRDTIQVAGVKLWASTGWGIPIGKGQKKELYQKETEIIALSAALAIRGDIFNKISGFDEEEAVVTEDLDFSWRIWLTGSRILLSPNAYVYHWTKNIQMRKNMKHTTGIIYYHLTKNSLISLFKNYEIFHVLIYSLDFIIISILRAFYVIIKRGDFSALYSLIKAIRYVTIHIMVICKKRKQIQSNRKVSDNYLFHHVIRRQSLFTIYKLFLQYD